MNSVSGGKAAYDGVLEVWVNGVKMFSRTNMRWRTSTALKVQQVFFNWYHGGMSPPNKVMHYRMTDVVIADRYIGPKKK